MATRKKSGSAIVNMLTVAIMLATLIVVAVYALVFINPNLPFNPFPPPTDFPMADMGPTATNTPSVFLPPTWTATVDPSTATPTQTDTPEPTATPTENPPSATPEGESIQTGSASIPFVLQTNSPAYTANFANNSECSWQGIAGQVFDLDGGSLTGVTIHLSGTLDGQNVDLYTESGSAEAYGPAGYEFLIGDSPVTSTNTLWIRVYDEEESRGLSEKIFLSTYNDCERNLILVNWNQVGQWSG